MGPFSKLYWDAVYKDLLEYIRSDGIYGFGVGAPDLLSGKVGGHREQGRLM